MAKKVSEVYNLIADKYSRAFDRELPEKKFMDKFTSLLGKNAKVLDVGCGSGREMGYYLGRGFRITGLDISNNMLNIAKKKFPQTEFILGDMRKLEFGKNSFDAITFPYSLFHVNKKEVPKVLEKANEILKPRGVILMIMQEGDGEVYLDEPFLPSEKIYFNLYTEKELTEILNSAGFDILKIGRIIPGKEEIPYNKLVIIARRK
jgi:ubiquinone/menaquinone biosynthesis C-methylase UbiE